MGQQTCAMLAIIWSARLFSRLDRAERFTKPKRCFLNSCLFVHLKQKLLELKLPVVLSAGAGSLLRPSAPQEDALCSEHSGEDLWQHQRAARCFSNLTSNEKRASCTSAITAASLGGEPAQVEPSPLGAHLQRRNGGRRRCGLSAMSDWVKT